MPLQRVSIFGSSSSLSDSREYETARQIGRLAAQASLEVVNGGYTGIMEASARGAKEAGGRAVGITVKTFTYARPNTYLAKVIEAPNLFRRLAVLFALGDMYIVLPGSTGTLVELSLAWEFVNKGTKKKTVLADACWEPIRAVLPDGANRGRVLKETPSGWPWTSERLFFCSDLAGCFEAFLRLGLDG